MSTVEYQFRAQQIVNEGRTTWKDINLLKTWLKSENLPKLTDEQIVVFLLSCLNEQEPARATIKAHYRIKHCCPEIFDNRTMTREDVQKQLNTVEICCFPERTSDGCCICLTRIYDTNFRNFNLGPMLKAVTMVLEAELHDSPPTGLIGIIDMKGVGIMHLTRYRYGVAKHFLEYVQEGLTLRLKEVHVLNTAYFIDKLLFLLKPFLKKELLDMITFHPVDMDMELFYKKYVPKRCFPEDYGGDLPSVRIIHQQSIDKLTRLERYFEQEEIQRRDIELN